MGGGDRECGVADGSNGGKERLRARGLGVGKVLVDAPGVAPRVCEQKRLG